MVSFAFLALLFITGNAQVNKQTGAAEQSFPLINFNDTKSGLSTGVALVYSSGNGLLVNEISSDVGTGWSLNAGGIITRLQNGEPDDQQEYYSGRIAAEINDNAGVSLVLKSYPNGFLYNSNVGMGCNLGQQYYPVYKKQNVIKERPLVAADVEQDKFVFSFNGRSGTFVLGRDGSVTILGDSRIKITYSTADLTAQGIRTRINQFVAVTEDGIKYTFSDLSLSNICRYKFASQNVNGTWTVNTGDADDGEYAINRFWGFPLTSDERPYIVNSWFLTTMENTNNGQKINFTYQTINSDQVIGKFISHQRNLNYKKHRGQHKRNKTGRDWYKYLSNPSNAEDFSWNLNQLDKLKPASISIVYNHSVTVSKRLIGIGLPNGGNIYIKYNPIPRIDLNGENAISTIEYFIKGVKVRAYELKQGYFNKYSIKPYDAPFTSIERKFARLCLLSIQKIGTGIDNAIEPPYKFDYYLGGAGKFGTIDDFVPPQNSLSQDHWGYYNGINSGLDPNEDHDNLNDGPNQYIKTVLPTYKTPKNNYARNGLLKSVTYPTGGSLQYSYQQIVPAVSVLPAGYPTIVGGVAVSQTLLSDGMDLNKNIIDDYAYVNSSGVSSRWGDERPAYYGFSVSDYSLKFSRFVFNKPGLQYPEMATSPDLGKVIGKALLNAAIGLAIETAIKYAIVLIFTNSASWIIPIVNIVIFAYTIIKLMIDIYTPLQSHRFTLANNNNILINPLPSGFSTVEVRSNSPSGYNGKTVYQFTDLTDFPPIVAQNKRPYIQYQRTAAWAYGLLKKTSIYDKNNALVKENSANYNYIKDQVATQANFNCNCYADSHKAQKNSDWEGMSNTGFSLAQFSDAAVPRRYFPYTGRTDELFTSEKTYNNGVLTYSSTTTTITDPRTLLQKGKIIQSDANSVLISITYYPMDFNLPGSAIEKLKVNNAIHLPVSTETWKLKIFPTQTPKYSLELLDANVTEYAIYTFGVSPNTRQEVKPYRTYTLKSKTPVSAAVIGMHNPAQLLRVPSYYKLQSEMTYDTEGNLVQTISDDNVKSFINDYSDRYVVASVGNAAFADIAYSGFESDRKGNWTFNPAFIKSTFSITGSKAFQLGFDATVGSTSTITRSGLTASKTYIASYWVRFTGTENVLINGTAGQLLFSGIDGWRLYQHSITGTTSLNITGTGLIDELRLFPQGALMSTVSYKEGIGKITECDANNRILNYEYDGLGRLKLIKDQNRNIIKTYEYNYKQ